MIPIETRSGAEVLSLHGSEEAKLDREIEHAMAEAERLERDLPPYYRDTLLPDRAIVEVVFKSAELANIGNAAKWIALFEITDCPEDRNLGREAIGKTLLRSWNPPRRGWITPQHNLARDFAAVTGRRMRTVPKAAPRAVIGMFLRDCRVRARTKVVRQRMDRETGRWVDQDHGYSRIDELLGLVAGCPPVLRRKK